MAKVTAKTKTKTKAKVKVKARRTSPPSKARGEPSKAPATAAKAGSPARSAQPAKVRAWKAANGGRAYRRFVCGRHLVWWTGSQLTSLDIATGAIVGKVPADAGAPWVRDDEVWVPTKTGFAIHSAATLAVTRQIETPIPTSNAGTLRFIAGLARVCGDVAYRCAQTTQVTKVGSELRQTYFLSGFDIRSRTQLFLTELASTAFPQVHGDCVADRFAITFDAGKRLVTGALPAGTIISSEKQDHSSIVVIGDHLVAEPNGNNKYTGSVLFGDAWKKLPCAGELSRIGDHVYCIGFSEIARLGASFAVAARTPISLPPRPDKDRIPLTTACLSRDALLVLEHTQSWPASLRDFDTPIAYRVTWRDPMTLAELRTSAFSESFGVRLIGEVDGITVAATTSGFLGLRL